MRRVVANYMKDKSSAEEADKSDPTQETLLQKSGHHGLANGQSTAANPDHVNFSMSPDDVEMKSVQPHDKRGSNGAPPSYADTFKTRDKYGKHIPLIQLERVTYTEDNLSGNILRGSFGNGEFIVIKKYEEPAKVFDNSPAKCGEFR